VDVYTIGFTQTSASRFFGTLKQHGIRRLIDVRLNNVSQLAGFTRRDDLAYFLREILRADYVHEPQLAPTTELLSAYRKKQIDWATYELRFLQLMAERRIEQRFPLDSFAGPSALMCSEAIADRCHRRLVLEYLQRTGYDLRPVHL
jgi:uncharacterized protein (DUF488 family)